MPQNNLIPQAAPHTIHDGLAVYSIGEGPTVLLMPPPHGFPLGPAVEGHLAQVLLKVGCQVVTFDPPGAFQSSRPLDLGMPEILECTGESLDVLKIQQPITVLGHSMAGLCAIAYSLAHPDLVAKLVLVGALSGAPAIARCKAMPWGRWLTGSDRWKFTLLGLRLSMGRGNLVTHKKLLRLLWKASHVDQSLIPELEVLPTDRRLAAPPRDAWPRVARKLDYSMRLGELAMPTLVCVGRSDPQAPVACSEELARAIPQSRLVIFERSGHYPFVEEVQAFTETLSDFLAA